MFEKKVHWASSNESHDISPAHESPTPPSSSGSPEPMRPPSPAIPAVLEINEILRYKPHLGYILDLQYDPIGGWLLDTELLNEAATEPGLSRLNVISSKIPYTFSIFEPEEGMEITVGDLLREVYMALQEQVTAEDMDRAGEEIKNSVFESFERRCDRVIERNVARAAQEREFGPRRIDYLGGFSVLAGFDVAPRDDDHRYPTVRLHVR